jgi:hypothetical protein
MSLWRLAYKALDVHSINWYPNKCPMKQLIHVPNFDGNPSLATTHVIEFIEFIIHCNIEQDYVIIHLFPLQGKYLLSEVITKVSSVTKLTKNVKNVEVL